MRDACEAFSILTIRHDGRAGVNEFRPYPWVHIRHDCPAGSILYASFCVSSKMMRNNRPIVARFTPPSPAFKLFYLISHQITQNISDRRGCRYSVRKERKSSKIINTNVYEEKRKSTHYSIARPIGSTPLWQCSKCNH